VPSETKQLGESAPAKRRHLAHLSDVGSVACELAELSFGAVDGYASAAPESNLRRFPAHFLA